MVRKWLCAVLCILLLISGCASENETGAESGAETISETDTGLPEGEKVLLADYYEQVVGTPMEQPFYELALYTYDDENLLLERYENGGTDSEYVTGYLVSGTAYGDFIEAVDRYEMGSWNDQKDMTSITGKTYVCKFRQNGEYTRVSSERMPSDAGVRAFDAVRAVLESYIDDSKTDYEYYVYGEPEESSVKIIADQEELFSYMAEHPVTAENAEEFFELSDGMEPRGEEYGDQQGEVYCYIRVYINEGYFPCNDLSLTVSYRVQGEEECSEKLEQIIWKIYDFPYRTGIDAADFEETVSFDKVSFSEAEGTVISFDIPEEYLYEDENGQYFWFENSYTKYYLDGRTGEVTGDGMGGEGTYVSEEESWGLDLGI